MGLMALKRKRAGRPRTRRIARHGQIAFRLATTRVALGYENQSEYAKIAGLSQNRYNQYETGERTITIEAALKLKKAYGISLDWIYDGDRHGLPRALWSALAADQTALKAS